MIKQKRLLAIHDISCIGRCSLTVALPILSAAGFDTSVLPTAVLSTHTGGFTDFTYRDLTEDITPIAKHWKSLNIKFDAMYSGFLGSFEQIALVEQLFKDFQKKNTLLMVDPVMADNGLLYSIYSPKMARGMAKLCTKADIIVPNLTEAAFILDEAYVGSCYKMEYIEQTLQKLAELGCKQVVLTGVSFEENKIGAACFDSKTNSIGYAFSPKAPGYFHGTGDVFGSTLLAALLNKHNLHKATKIAVDYTYLCITETLKAKQELRYGVCFERALPQLIQQLGLMPK